MKNIILYTKPIPINQKFFIHNGRNILSNKYRDTKYALALETRSKWQTEALQGTIEMAIHLYFGDKRKRDIDCYLKILLDALTGIVYEDDSQINILHVFKHLDKDNPRTEIDIKEII
jgi:crossover junction endodeoxyribonuclease RusA